MPDLMQKIVKKCEECGVAYFTFDEEGSVCPKCQDRNYFGCIRRYIDDEEPTVEELSTELRVPKIRIYRWIRDGRIQYIPGTGMTGIFCEECGIPIEFGSVCIKCAKNARKKKRKKKKIAI
ncbi:hypothetical protein SAMN02910358_00558 [Lachnospiraceae bacterium XBB1006]|nr:hypothetical protein SAMN02910358_00558 [Lachnospiraceae bacterium XBB1006]